MELLRFHSSDADEIKFRKDPTPIYLSNFTEFLNPWIFCICNIHIPRDWVDCQVFWFLHCSISSTSGTLREQVSQKENKSKESGLDLSSLSFLPKANSDYSVGDSPNNTNEPQSEEYDQDYLDRNDLAIGMNGQPIAKYLADIEKKLRKPLSTLWEILLRSTIDKRSFSAVNLPTFMYWYSINLKLYQK